jgi:tetratricopeptide (TPR) repeat protein
VDAACDQADLVKILGSLHTTLLRFDQASAELAMAAQIFQEVGDDRGFAHATFHLASIDRLSGRLDEATSRYQQALAIFRTSADEVATASVLHGLAQVKLERNEAGAAMELLSEALRLCQTTGYPRLEAQVMLRLGEACLLTEQPGHAAGTFERVLAIATEIGDVIGASYALQGVGVAATRQGDFDRARDALKRTAQLADSVGERMAEARAQIGMSELGAAPETRQRRSCWVTSPIGRCASFRRCRTRRRPWVVRQDRSAVRAGRA